MSEPTYHGKPLVQVDSIGEPSRVIMRRTGDRHATRNFPNGPDIMPNGDRVYEPGVTCCCPMGKVLRIGDERVEIVGAENGLLTFRISK